MEEHVMNLLESIIYHSRYVEIQKLLITKIVSKKCDKLLIILIFFK